MNKNIVGTYYYLMDNFKRSLVQRLVYIKNQLDPMTLYLSLKMKNIFYHLFSRYCYLLWRSRRLSNIDKYRRPISNRSARDRASFLPFYRRFTITDIVGDAEIILEKKKREREQRTKASLDDFIEEELWMRKRRDPLGVDRSMIVWEGSRRESYKSYKMVY